MKNKLIVFEGIDGVGKTTLAHELKKALTSIGIKTVLYEDTEDTISGYNLLKPFINNEVKKKNINASLLFYLSSSLYKSELIKGLLKNQWVICDRYVYSTIAKHLALGCEKKLIPNLNSFPIIKPDYSFLVTVDEKTRLARLKLRSVNTKADLIKKTKSTLGYKMEKELKKLKLKPLNNTLPLYRSINNIINKLTS